MKTIDEWIIRDRKSKFISLFPSQIPSGHWCPGFWYVKPIFGCSHDCRTCFMHRIRRSKGFPNTVYSNVKDLSVEMGNFMRKHKNTMLCFGTETGDMLKERALIEKAWGVEPERFAHFIFKDTNNKILFCSKSANVDWFYKNKPSDNVIISFSINGFRSAEHWERGTCPMVDRLNAIEKLIKQGWTVRVRVDPLLIDQNFYKGDIKYIADFLNAVNVEAITSGVMRYRKAPIFSTEMQIEGVGYFFNLLSDKNKDNFMVCKTDLEVIDKLGIRGHSCNCMFGKKQVHSKTSQLSFFI